MVSSVPSVIAHEEDGQVMFKLTQSPEGVEASIGGQVPVRTVDERTQFLQTVRASQQRALLNKIRRADPTGGDDTDLSVATLTCRATFDAALKRSRELMEAYNTETRKMSRLITHLTDSHSAVITKENNAIAAFEAMSGRARSQSKRADPRTAPLGSSWLDEAVLASAYAIRLLERQFEDVASYMTYVDSALEDTSIDAQMPPHKPSGFMQMLRSIVPGHRVSPRSNDDDASNTIAREECERKKAIYASSLNRRLKGKIPDGQDDGDDSGGDWVLRDCTILNQTMRQTETLQGQLHLLLPLAAAKQKEIHQNRARKTVEASQISARTGKEVWVGATDRERSDLIISHVAALLNRSLCMTDVDVGQQVEWLTPILKEEKKYTTLMRGRGFKIDDKVDAAQRAVHGFTMRRYGEMERFLLTQEDQKPLPDEVRSTARQQANEVEDEDGDIASLRSFTTALQTPDTLSRRTTAPLSHSRRSTRQGSLPPGSWWATDADLDAEGWTEVQASRWIKRLREYAKLSLEERKRRTLDRLASTRQVGSQWIGQRFRTSQEKSKSRGHDDMLGSRSSWNLQPTGGTGALPRLAALYASPDKQSGVPTPPPANFWTAKTPGMLEWRDFMVAARAQRMAKGIRPPLELTEIGETGSTIIAPSAQPPQGNVINDRSEQPSMKADWVSAVDIPITEPPEGISRPDRLETEPAQDSRLLADATSVTSPVRLETSDTIQNGCIIGPYFDLVNALYGMIENEVSGRVPANQRDDFLRLASAALRALTRQDQADLAGEWTPGQSLYPSDAQSASPKSWTPEKGQQSLFSTLFGSRVFALPEGSVDDMAAGGSRRSLRKVPFRPRSHSVVGSKEVEDHMRVTARDLLVVAEENWAREQRWLELEQERGQCEGDGREASHVEIMEEPEVLPDPA